MTLPEFLLARFAEDEKIGRLLQRSSLGENNRVRLLVDCEAQSAIVRLHRRHEDDANFEHWNRAEQRMERWQGPACGECGHIDENPMEWPCLTLRLLALPYADHPDFADEWRVE